MNNMENAPVGFGERVRWWPVNQISFTFFSPLPPTPENKGRILASLHLDDINTFIARRYNVTLRSFTPADVAQPGLPSDQENGESLLDEGLEKLGEGLEAVGEVIEKLGEGIEHLGEKLVDRSDNSRDGGDSSDQKKQTSHPDQNLTSPVGKYLFAGPGGQGSTVITFFHLVPGANAASNQQMANADTGMTSHPNITEGDVTVTIVNAINNAEFIPTATDGDTNPLKGALPNWNQGTVQDVIHGCPASPPMPLAADIPCISTGECPIILPNRSEQMQDEERDGSGVRVFVLDTIPKPDVITDASAQANPDDGVQSNTLLLRMATNMQTDSPYAAPAPAINVHYQRLPAFLEDDHAPRTGRDLYKILYGFKMPDHGLAIAGMIRSLAPGAQIECMRMLNDYGVSRMSELIQALNEIHMRIPTLTEKQVVINLSLVITPDDMTLNDLGLIPPTPSQQDRVRAALRAGIRLSIQALVEQNVVVVGSAGNDSNTPEMPMRVDPRYPAAFPEVIAVAAVNSAMKAAVFSDRANPASMPSTGNGIATYGGDLATPVPPTGSTFPGCMTGATGIDALVGVYTAASYPKLSYATDCEDSYPAPDNSAWAYWSGTSFATALMSGLVTLVVQPGMNLSTSGLSSVQVVATINSTAVNTGAPLAPNLDLNAPVFPATQCSDAGVSVVPGGASGAVAAIPVAE